MDVHCPRDYAEGITRIQDGVHPLVAVEAEDHSTELEFGLAIDPQKWLRKTEQWNKWKLWA